MGNKISSKVNDLVTHFYPKMKFKEDKLRLITFSQKYKAILDEERDKRDLLIVKDLKYIEDKIQKSKMTYIEIKEKLTKIRRRLL